MGLYDLTRLNVDEMRKRGDVKGLVKTLHSGCNLDVLREAEKALGDIGDKLAVEPLIHALKDKDSSVRYEAAKALGKIKATRAVKPLIHALKDGDADVRRSSVTALINIGEPAVKALVHALKDGDSVVRSQATEALENLGWKPADDWERSYYLIAKKEWNELARFGEPAVEALIQALKDEDSDIRSGVADALSVIRDRKAVEPLILALDDESWEVRRAAVMALGVIGDARAVEPLIWALNDEYWNVNRKAEKALAMIGEPAVELLIRTLHDNSWGVRQRAAGALGAIGDVRAVEALIQALSDTVLCLGSGMSYRSAAQACLI